MPTQEGAPPAPAVRIVPRAEILALAAAMEKRIRAGEHEFAAPTDDAYKHAVLAREDVIDLALQVCKPKELRENARAHGIDACIHILHALLRADELSTLEVS